MCKLHQMGQGAWSRDLLLNVRTPFISPERLKLETSNFVCLERARSFNEKYANYVKRGQGAGSRDLLLNF